MFVVDFDLQKGYVMENRSGSYDNTLWRKQISDQNWWYIAVFFEKHDFDKD